MGGGGPDQHAVSGAAARTVRSLRRTAHRAIRASARDMTAQATARSCLVIAPHPDDETLGCGATILRKVRAGSEVCVLLATDGRHSHNSVSLPPPALADLRRREMAEAARRLGLPDSAVLWAGLTDGAVAEREGELVELIGRVLADRRPREVYATCADEPHPDHAAVGRAARRAAWDHIRAGRGSVNLYEYPVWLWGSWPLTRSAPLGSAVRAIGLAIGRTGRRVDATDVLEAKLHALSAHASQLRRPPGIPLDEEWVTLPAEVLAAAREPHELFLPVTDLVTGRVTPRAGKRGSAGLG